MMNSNFYDGLYDEKAKYEERLNGLKIKIAQDLKEDDYVHMAKLAAEASGLLEKIKSYDDMIDSFEFEFNKQDEEEE